MMSTLQIAATLLLERHGFQDGDIVRISGVDRMADEDFIVMRVHPTNYGRLRDIERAEVERVATAARSEKNHGPQPRRKFPVPR